MNGQQDERPPDRPSAVGVPAHPHLPASTSDTEPGTCECCRASAGRVASDPPVAVRAVRGATQVERDLPDLIVSATGELLSEVIDRNGLAPDDLISVWFTVTQDLTSVFPAAAARDRLGLTTLPMLCATEIAVPGALPRVIRLMAHVRTTRPAAAIRHVYLRGAAQLRTDTSSSTAHG